MTAQPRGRLTQGQALQFLLLRFLLGEGRQQGLGVFARWSTSSFPPITSALETTARMAFVGRAGVDAAGAALVASGVLHERPLCVGSEWELYFQSRPRPAAPLNSARTVASPRPSTRTRRNSSSGAARKRRSRRSVETGRRTLLSVRSAARELAQGPGGLREPVAATAAPAAGVGRAEAGGASGGATGQAHQPHARPRAADTLEDISA